MSIEMRLVNIRKLVYFLPRELKKKRNGYDSSWSRCLPAGIFTDGWTFVPEGPRSYSVLRQDDVKFCRKFNIILNYTGKTVFIIIYTRRVYAYVCVTFVVPVRARVYKTD